MDVCLRKLGRKGGRIVEGRLVRPPRNGSVVVIEFPDGLHEYVTTPVKRVLRLVGNEVFFLQTSNDFSGVRAKLLNSDSMFREWNNNVLSDDKFPKTCNE